jgi:hypothetical protein
LQPDSFYLAGRIDALVSPGKPVGLLPPRASIGRVSEFGATIAAGFNLKSAIA